jgi:hypothetical protein
MREVAISSRASASTERASTSKDALLPLAALVAVVAFAAFVIAMLRLAGAEETAWTRALYLFGGIEAVAFAAGGFVFGREVHRQQAEKAEQRAEQALQQAEQARQRAATVERAAANGQTLAEFVRAKAASWKSSRAGHYGGLGSGAAAATQADFDELADLAGRLFPS